LRRPWRQATSWSRSIHPSQIEIANDVFAPSEKEIEFAKKQVEAYEKAAAGGEGAGSTGGMLVEQVPSPPDALPAITYDDRMQFHFNGERIDLMYFGSAHTTGDTAVILRGRNVAHLGDVFNTGGYPFIDADNGGDIDGVILFCEGVLREIDENTIVVPGHGPIGTQADLAAYVSMLRTIRERVAMLIADGATLEEVIAANPTAEWDAVRGDPVRLLDRAYASLTR